MRFEVTKSVTSDTIYGIEAEDEEADLAAVQEGVRTGQPIPGLLYTTGSDVQDVR